MHTRDITLPDGRTAHVHYNSDWSGDVVIVIESNGQEPESAVMSAALLLALLSDPELREAGRWNLYREYCLRREKALGTEAAEIEERVRLKAILEGR